MNKLKYHLRRAMLGALFLFLFSPSAYPQSESQFRDFVSPAKRIVHILYPDLHGLIEAEIIDESHWTSDVQEMSGFRLKLYEIQLSSVGQHVGRIPVLSSNFLFNAGSADIELSLLMFSGTASDDPRLGALAKQVEAHPEWSDTQIAKALTESGAKYGPDNKDEFIRQLPLKELAPYVGDLELVSVELSLRDPYRGSTVLTWFVTAKKLGSNNIGHHNEPKECNFQFDPFNGKLQYLHCE